MVPSADPSRELALVLLALEHGLTDQAALLDAFRAWGRRGDRSLLEVMLERGDLDPAGLARLRDLDLDPGGPDAPAATLGSPARPSAPGEAPTLPPGADPATCPTLPDGTVARPADGLDLSETLAARDGGPAALGEPTSAGARFLILRGHAEGGLGVVSVALDAELKREVALKQIKDRYADDPASRQRFMLEAEITGGLEHPGIVPVYGLGADASGRPYYAMRLIRGESFRQAVRRFHADPALADDPGARGLELRKLLRRFVDACNAIGYAHGRNVLHRDIKPENIMIGPHGETLVVDWGIAKAYGRPEHAPEPGAVPGAAAPGPAAAFAAVSAGGATQTMPGSTLGTAQYMSPEQAEGRLDRLGPASDVYSLGATLYYLLAGRPSIATGPVMTMLRAVARGDFPPPRAIARSVPAGLESICLKAMALRPEGRYPSAQALAEDVERWMADEPITARVDPPLERAARWMRRRRTLVAALAAGLVFAGAGLLGVLVVQGRANAELREANLRERERFLLAMDAIRTYYSGVSEDLLLKQKEFDDLRRKLLDNAREFYRKLEDQLRGTEDRELRRALSRGYFDVGEMSNLVGSTDQALASHRLALDLRRRLAEADEVTIEDLADVGRSLLAIGRLVEAQGRMEEAEGSYRQAEATLAPLTARRPDDSALAAERAAAWYQIGRLLSKGNRTDEARASLGQALRMLALASTARPDDPRVLGDTARCLDQLAEIDRLAGRTAEALAGYEEARAIRDRLVEDAPGDLERIQDLAISDAQIGRILSDLMGRKEDARLFLERAIEARARLASASPSVAEFQDRLARSYQNLARLLGQLGRRPEQLEALEHALGIREGLVRLRPEVADFQVDLATVLSDKANTLAEEGRTDEALALYLRARDIEERVAARDPTTPRYRANLAVSHMVIGQYLHEKGRTTEARASYRRARDLLEALAEADPGSIQNLRYLAAMQRTLGAIALEDGRPAEAADEFAGAIRLYERLVDLTPDSTGSRLNRIATRAALAALEARAGRGDDALDDLRAAREAIRELRDANPDDRRAAADLAGVDDLLAVALARAGRDAEAVEAAARARDTWRALADAEPAVIAWPENLARNRLESAEAAWRAGRLDDARAAALEAIGANDDLIEDRPDAAPLRAGLAACWARLGAIERADGRPAAAASAFRRAAALVEEASDPGPVALATLARAHAGLAALDGDGPEADLAADALARAVGAGYRDRDEVVAHPDFDPVRAHPPYPDLLLDLAFPFDPFAPGSRRNDP